ncbi:endonuclease III [Candidatus Bipolaricaulota bacterium]|nr:endonuclease III [Candidatus Bipolaricaulota bacterium]
MDSEEKARSIAERLQVHYGEVTLVERDPLELLVETILSQNTNDTNRDRAYRSLLDRFGSLTAVREATVADIAAAIQIGGLHHQKASHIKQTLAMIALERGLIAHNLTDRRPNGLAFLADLPLDKALCRLLTYPGVGKKTAGIVLLFAFDRPYFPVDTHIKRIATRVGLIRKKEDPHQRMNFLLPHDPVLMKRLHLQLIRLGREICRARRAECCRCPLRDICAWFSEKESSNSIGVAFSVANMEN